jgi:hypothetical protein
VTSLDPHSILGRLVCLLLAAVMPSCCCTVQALGDVLDPDDPTSIVERPACCCAGGASACSTEDGDDENDPAPSTEGCHCVRSAPILDAPTDQVLARLTLPVPIMVAWASDASSSVADANEHEPAVRANAPPDDDGPPATSARRLRRAIILQV